MKNCNDLDLINCNLIENYKWKSVRDCTSQISVKDRKHARINRNSPKRVIDTLHELKI